MRIPIRTLLQSRRGSAAVEFAFLAPLVLLLLFGTMEAGRAVWTQNTLQFAAEEAARFSMVNQSADDGDITSFALDRVTGIDPAAVRIRVVRDTVEDIEFVRIELGTDFLWLTPILPGGAIELVGSSRVPLIE